MNEHRDIVYEHGLSNESKRLIGAARRKEFLRLFAKHGCTKTCAEKLGIARTTVYAWCDRYPAFKAAMDRLKGRWVEDVETSYIQSAVNGNSAAARHILERWKPERYAPELHLKISQSTEQFHRFIGFDGKDIVTGELVDQEALEEAEVNQGRFSALPDPRATGLEDE